MIVGNVMDLDVPRAWAPLKIELTHIRTATKTQKSPLVKASMLTENKYKQQDTKSYQLVHITFPSRTCRAHFKAKEHDPSQSPTWHTTSKKARSQSCSRNQQCCILH